LEERERGIERGCSGRKRKRNRGLLAKPPSPSSSSIQNRGGRIGGGRPAGSGDCRRSRSRQRPGLGAKGGGDHGGSIPTLTLSWGGARERLPGWQRTACIGGWGGLVGGAVERKEGCGGSMARWWTTRKPGSICRRPKAVWGGKYRWLGSPVEAVLGGRPDSWSPAMGRLEQDDGTARAGGG
jgi:hypothetical protein